ncbi:MAG: cell division protein ZapE [Halieaceae bacterium]|nr:cell division protein ZapE [Halieaceae bacterium]
MQTISDKKRNDPLRSYHMAIENGLLDPDQSQRDCVIQLNNLFYRLLERECHRQTIKGRLHEWIYSKYLPVRGLYLWGGVGRGKTFFVDTFFDCLPFDGKLRLHFHRFMNRVHQGLRENQGDKNPLQKVADNFSNEARIIFFDEFMVSDVADAMILGELIGCLLKRGVTIVATSNIAPQELYKNGLQRQRFLPVIEYLHRFTEVMHVEGSIDYRYRSLKSPQFYFSPLNVLSEEGVKSCFDQIARGRVINDEYIRVNDRLIPYLKMSSKVVWFDFEVICGDARSQNDYLFLANAFDAVIITNVRVCSDDDNDVVRRLINLVDIFYDHGIKLVITAETEPGGLYTGYRLAFEFDRTASRLNEMKAGDYLLLKSEF